MSHSKRSGQRVLVVDNNLDATDSLVMLLRMWGYAAEACYGGAAALEAVRSHRPAVVLLDIGMPGVDGFEVARSIRAETASEETVLIGVTGWAAESYRVRAREFGFDHYLLKPLDLDELPGLLDHAASGRAEFEQAITSRTASLAAALVTPEGGG